MKNFPRLLHAALLAAGALLTISPQGQIGIAVAQAQAVTAAVRPEIARPLKAAADLMRARRFKEALARVNEADAVPNRTAAEQLTIERARGSAALGAGDYASASRAFEHVMASGNLPAAEQVQIAQALASAEYSAGHYGKAIQWARQAPNSAGMGDLVAAAMFQSGDYAGVVRQVSSEVEADEKAGRRPSQRDLELLANCYQKTGNTRAVMDSLEKLLAYYPRKDTWASVLSRLPRKPGFSERFELDLYRLRLATDSMSTADDYMEATQLALQDGLTGEGRKIIDMGFTARVLGTGPDAERQKRLADMAAKRDAQAQTDRARQITNADAATEGDDLVRIGYALVASGQPDKGIVLIEKGIARGGLKHPDDARLHLGIAQLQAGRKADALQTLRGVRGDDGAADIARLWILLSGQQPVPTASASPRFLPGSGAVALESCHLHVTLTG